MKKFLIMAVFPVIFLACCTIKIQEGETEDSFLIRACMESAKKSGNFAPCEKMIDQYVKLQDDKRLYQRYEYCKNSKDDSQKFTECWLSFNQK